MQIKIIDNKAWELLLSALTNFLHNVEQLVGNPPEDVQWLDNDAVYRRLNISRRTLQTYRDTGKIAFSMVGRKIYYRSSDVEQILEQEK